MFPQEVGSGWFNASSLFCHRAKQLCTAAMMMRLVSYFAIIQPERGLVKESVSGRVRLLAAASALLACHGSIWPDGGRTEQ